MQPDQSSRFFSSYFVSGLAKNGVRHEPTAHADPAMNPPHGELDADTRHRLAPREHMLINAIDQRAIQIEQKGGSPRIGFTV
jgi:hypothetical protein